MGGGTGAIEVGNKLWVSSMKADRIAIFSLKWRWGVPSATTSCN